LLDLARQGLGRHETVAEFNDALNLTPVHCFTVEAHAEPTTVTDIGRQIEALRVTARTVYVFAELGLAADGNNSVTVMVVQKIGEDLLSDTKVCVVATQRPICLGKCQAERTKAL